MASAGKLKGKTALVTGGSRGIGKAVAKAFLDEGARVVIAARNKEEIDRTKKELAAIGSGVDGFVADVSNPKDIAALVAATVERLGGIDILVNAAGIYGPIGPSAEVNLAAWEETFAINVFGTFALVQKVLPGMEKKGKGKIINFSGGGDGPLPRFSAYSASKVAIVRLTETIAEEVKKNNVDMNAIAPGAVNTKFLDDALAAGEGLVGRERYLALLKQKKEGGVPPEKTAELCVFLASDASDGLTGKMLSAKWDDWKHWDKKKIGEFMSSDMLTLRRVNPPQ